jgi:ethanolamine ammonia-lyase small subunit
MGLTSSWKVSANKFVSALDRSREKQMPIKGVIRAPEQNDSYGSLKRDTAARACSDSDSASDPTAPTLHRRKAAFAECYFVSFSDASKMEEIADSPTSPAEL